MQILPLFNAAVCSFCCCFVSTKTDVGKLLTSTMVDNKIAKTTPKLYFKSLAILLKTRKKCTRQKNLSFLRIVRKKNTSLTSRFSFSHLRRIFKKEFQKPEFLQLKLFPTLEQLYILFQKNKIKLRELYPSASLCVRFPNNVSAFAIYT